MLPEVQTIGGEPDTKRHLAALVSCLVGTIVVVHISKEGKSCTTPV